MRIYTTAPEGYDGFGTRRLHIAGTTHRGQTVWEVEVEEGYSGWQLARYASGMHLAVPPEEWRKLIEYKFATVLVQVLVQATEEERARQNKLTGRVRPLWSWTRGDAAALLKSYPPEEGTAFAIFRLPPPSEHVELWLHRSTLHPDGWRVTRLDKRPEWAHIPFSGHMEHATFEEAIHDILHDRAVFVSRNTEPVLLDPSLAFRAASNDDLVKHRDYTRDQIALEKARGSVVNLPMFSNLLFAIEEEMRRRGMLAAVCLSARPR